MTQYLQRIELQDFRTATGICGQKAKYAVKELKMVQSVHFTEMYVCLIMLLVVKVL